MKSILLSPRIISQKFKVLQMRSVSSNVVKHFRREFSSLGSPMFPHVRVPEVTAKVVPKGEEDFMTRNGGKIAAVALAITAVIIYTYYESGRSKTAVEDGLNDRMVIEPYEVNEIRFLNNLTPAVYEELSASCLSHFSIPFSANTSEGMPHWKFFEREATYPDFVMYVQQFLERKNARNGDDARASVAIKHTGERERSEKENLEDKIPLFHLKGGHLFDRLMSNHILSGRNARKNIIDKINSNNSSSVEEIDEGKRKGEGEGEGEGDYHSNLPEKNNSVTTTPISVTYMLVALNMAVKTAAEERVDSLFSIAHILSKRNDQEKNINCFGGDHGSEIGIENSNSVVGEKHTESGIVASESNAYAPLDQITTASNNVETAHIDGSEEEADSLVSVRSVEEIVRELYDTCQVPNEKRVAETGVNYPIKTYREKTASEMISGYMNGLKPPNLTDKMSKNEFRELILGSHVCAWAECYRSR